MKTRTPQEEKELFDKSLKTLVEAYLNDELERGRCEACVVGNLLGGRQEWKRLFMTPWQKEYGQLIAGDGELISYLTPISNLAPMKISECRNTLHLYQYEEGLELIRKSGFEKLELARIEFNFERNVFGETDDEKMFNGLMSTVDLLAEILHIDLTSKEQAKKLFVKA